MSISFPVSSNMFSPASFRAANPLSAVLEEFDVVRKFNVIDIQDVDVFLFPTQHKTEECAELIGEAISEIAKDNSNVIVFVEGTSKAGELLAEKDFLLQYLNIDPALRDKLHFYSWDLKNEEGHCLFTNNMDDEMERLEEALETLEETYEEVESQLEESFPELRDPEILREYSPEERQELTYLLNVHGALVEKKLSLANQLKELVGKADQMDADTFPERTMSMVDSLQYITSLKSQFAGKTAVAFVSGASHICQEEAGGNNLDLGPLYHELQNHRAMILLPKIYNQISDIPVRF